MIRIYFLSSSNNYIINNKVLNNTRGIYLYGSSNNNSLTGNNISNNIDGISIDSSHDNQIYHNNFVNNSPNAYKGIPDYVIDSMYGTSTDVLLVDYNVIMEPTPENPTLTISTKKVEGKWICTSVDDPYENKVPIKNVERADGKILSPQNYWMRDGRILIVDDPVQEYYIEYYFTTEMSYRVSLSAGWNLISAPLNLTTWELGDESVVGNWDDEN
jgi:parallel beta-helix repeat protein